MNPNARPKEPVGNDFEPVVSVCITTYNHEKYIRQAIESVLAQESAYSMEVLVGEDESTDSTRQIVQELAAQHPGLIKPFYNDRSDVLYIDGRSTGRRNLINLLNHARGRYIAILDGDDYWLDPTKAQKQVDFMENNPYAAMCFHDALIVDDQDHDSGLTYCRGRLREGEVAVEEMIEANKVPISSALFRREAILPPVIAETVRAYDWLLAFIAARNGKLHFMSGVLSAYRVHAGGVWQQMNVFEMVRAEMLNLWRMNLFLKKKHHKAFCKSIAMRASDLAARYRADGKPFRARVQKLNELYWRIVKPLL